MHVDFFLVQCCLNLTSFDAQGDVHKVDFLCWAVGFPSESLSAIHVAKESVPFAIGVKAFAFVASPNANHVVDETTVEEELRSMLAKELLFVQAEVNRGIRWGRRCAHCGPAQLPPEGVTELEGAPLHDDAKTFDDCIIRVRFVLVLLVTAEETGDLVEGMFSRYAGVHGHCVRCE